MTTKTHTSKPSLYMACDQYGQTFHGLQYPRRDLLKRLDATHADKMYCDGKDGRPKHIGYVIRGLWLRVYTVTDWQGQREA